MPTYVHKFLPFPGIVYGLLMPLRDEQQATRGGIATSIARLRDRSVHQAIPHVHDGKSKRAA